VWYSRLINSQLVSSTRIALPAFDPAELEKLIVALVATDAPKWLPASRPGSTLYLRPSMIGTAPALGVATPKEATLFIIATFVSVHFPSTVLWLTGADACSQQT
jgi:branched-subunit amino acid aminotransferase/4-amino-4-deoxychorismate lyase